MQNIGIWISSILGVAVLGVAVDMLLPEGRTRKAICSFLSALTVLVIVTPLPSIVSGKFSLDFTPVKIDSGYIDKSSSIIEDELETNLMSTLKDEGYSGFDVSIEINLDFTIKKVTIFSKNGILQNGEHIDKYDLTKTIVKLIAVGEEVITYE